MQLLPNLYQVGGDLMGLTWDGVDAGFNDANTYALRTDAGIVLIDSGCGDTLDQIFANMRAWDLDPAAIRACLLTHAHYDHAGAAHLLSAQGVEIIAHAETAKAVAAGDERCCGYLYHKTFTPVQVDRVVGDGDSIECCGTRFDVLHLPGHSMGCTAYLIRHGGKRIVFSGDVIGTLNVGDFGWSGSIDFDRTVYLASLRRFAKIDTDLMLPGHGMPYFHHPRRRVEQVLNTALMQWREPPLS